MPRLLPYENRRAGVPRSHATHRSHDRKTARSSRKQQQRAQSRDVPVRILWRLQSPV